MNEIRTGHKTNGQFTVDYQKAGHGGVIPVIDGKEEPSLMFGYASETDKAACMKLLEEALIATGGDIFATRRYLMNAVMIAAKEIKPDEVVEVDGTEVLISYAARKAYDNDVQIADLEDMKCELPNEAIKAMLVDRARLFLETRRNVEFDYADYEDDLEDDYE